MIETSQIVRAVAHRAAVIRLTIPRDAIRKVMGPAHGELMAAVAAQGIGTAGPWFSHHLRMAPRLFDFEIGVPVTSPVLAAGRVTPGELPAATVARTIFHGNHEGLGGAWSELDAWVATEGHAPRPDSSWSHSRRLCGACKEERMVDARSPSTEPGGNGAIAVEITNDTVQIGGFGTRAQPARYAFVRTADTSWRIRWKATR